MRWIETETIFRELLSRAEDLMSSSHEQRQNMLQRLVFDDAQLSTAEFATLVQSLIRESADQCAYYLVLAPDPVHYFYHHFNKYPLLRIDRGDSVESYLAALHEDPGGSPADAVGTNWSKSVIFPFSGMWFSQLNRSSSVNGGHLWIPSRWTTHLLENYAFLTAEPTP